MMEDPLEKLQTLWRDLTKQNRQIAVVYKRSEKDEEMLERKGWACKKPESDTSDTSDTEVTNPLFLLKVADDHHVWIKTSNIKQIRESDSDHILFP